MLPWLVALGFALGAFFVFLYFYVVVSHSTPTWWSDSYEYAQVGQNLAEGRGLVTFSPHVVEAWLLSSQALPLPYFLHDPGQALLLGLFFKVFGIQDANVGWATGLFYILIPPLTFLFARRAFNATVGVIAALLAIVNNQLVAFGMTGLSEVPYAFFLTFCLYSMYRQKKWWEIVLSGALFGWLAVLRSNTLPFIVLCALFIVLDPQEQGPWRLRERLAELLHSVRKPLLQLALFVLGVMFVFLPNMVRNYSLIENPLYNAASIYSLVFYTDAIEGKTATFLSMPGLDVDPVAYLAAHPDQLVSKMNYQLSNTLEQLWEGGIDNHVTWVDAILIVLLLAGVIIPRKDENARQTYLRWLVYLAIVSALIVGSIANLRWRHLYGFIPVVLIVDAELALFLLRAVQTRLNKLTPRQLPLVPVGLTVLILVLAGLSYAAVMRATNIGDAQNQDYRSVARWLERNTSDDALVLAEQGKESFGLLSALAWYTDRQMVEYSEYTSETIPAKRGNQPLYLLVIATSNADRKEILADPAFSGYVQVATLQRDTLPDANLYARPTVSLQVSPSP